MQIIVPFKCFRTRGRVLQHIFIKLKKHGHRCFCKVLFSGFRQDLQKLTGLRILSSQAGAMWRHDDWVEEGSMLSSLFSPIAKEYTMKILGTDISLTPNEDTYFQIFLLDTRVVWVEEETPLCSLLKLCKFIG